LRSSRILWILALAFYGVGDTYTTMENLKKGYMELNPLINMHSIIFLKIFIIFILFFIYRKTKSLVIPASLAVIGLMGIVVNASLIF